MARTYGDVITRARILLQDRVAPLRYEDAALYAHLDNAILEARRMRPDLFVGAIQDVIAYVTTSTTTLPIAEQFLPPLTAYVVGMADMGEDEYSNEGRAVALLERFKTTLGGGA